MKKRVLSYIMSVILLLSLAGCGNKEKTSEAVYNGDYIVVIDKVNSKLIREKYNISEKDRKNKVDELLKALYAYKDNKYASPIPDISIIKEWEFDENTVVLSFKNEYYNLPLIDEILVRAAIVNTLCQLDEVKDVAFWVDGSPLKIRDKVIGSMNSDSFLQDTEIANATANVTLYFPNLEKNCLMKIVKNVPSNNMYTDEQTVIEELIAGPGNNNLNKSLPDDTRLLNVVTKEMVCYVNLSREFLKYRDDVSAEMTIYSIVNSLIELSSIGSVVITVDGETLDYYQSVPINDKLTFNFELLEDKNE
ncbi:MAG: GerMN domain-containing protein [Clostridiales bacterium]|nr:GerMN domain-containing protein [Clostridiales bacterium]